MLCGPPWTRRSEHSICVGPCRSRDANLPFFAPRPGASGVPLPLLLREQVAADDFLPEGSSGLRRGTRAGVQPASQTARCYSVSGPCSGSDRLKLLLIQHIGREHQPIPHSASRQTDKEGEFGRLERVVDGQLARPLAGRDREVEDASIRRRQCRVRAGEEVDRIGMARRLDQSSGAISSSVRPSSW